LAEKVEVY